MVTYSREEIRQRALRGHVIDFLRSEAAANATAKRIADSIGGKISTLHTTVDESASHPGTWRISTWFIRAAEVSYTNRMMNQRADELIDAAVRAAYQTADLVDSWTRPARRWPR